MSNKIKAAALFVVALFIPALPVSAQNQSNLSKATAEVFSNEVDDFLDVNYFADTGFENWFGVADAGTSGSIGLGYARNIGPLYLGAYFSGNVIGSYNSHTKRLTTTWNVNLQEWTTKTERDTYSTSNLHTFNNDFNVLIGLGLGAASLGIKVGFEQDNYQTSRNPINAGRQTWTEVTTNFNGSIITTTNVQQEYEYKNGGMAIPKLEVGLNLGVGSMTLTPYLGATIGFYRNLFNDQWIASITEYTESALVPVTSTDTLNIRGYSNNYTNLDAYIGTGLEIGDMSFGVQYGLEMPIYSNTYDLFEGAFTDKVKGVTKWDDTNFTQSSKVIAKNLEYEQINETGHVELTEISAMSHKIAGGFRYAKDVTENFKLGATVGVPVVISKYTINEKAPDFYTDTVIYNDEVNAHFNYTETSEGLWQGNITDTSIFQIAGVVSLGATGTVGKWTFSGGVQLVPVNFTKETTTVKQNDYWTGSGKTEYADGYIEEWYSTNVPTDYITVTDTVNVIKTLNGISGSVRGGFTFAFNENLALDFQAGVGAYNAGRSTFNIDWADVNVMFMFKF